MSTPTFSYIDNVATNKTDAIMTIVNVHSVKWRYKSNASKSSALIYMKKIVPGEKGQNTDNTN